MRKTASKAFRWLIGLGFFMVLATPAVAQKQVSEEELVKQTRTLWLT